MDTRKCDRRESRPFRYRIIKIKRRDTESHLRARRAGRPASSHPDAWLPGTVTLFGPDWNSAPVQLLSSWPGRERLDPQAIPIGVKRSAAPSQTVLAGYQSRLRPPPQRRQIIGKITEPRCPRRKYKISLDSILYMQHTVNRETD
jgi:hypothetical protein